MSNARLIILGGIAMALVILLAVSCLGPTVEVSPPSQVPPAAPTASVPVPPNG